MTKIIAAALAGTALFAAAAPALALEPPAERVGYRDLDLSSAAGQRTLAHRMAAAANRVCPSAIGDAMDQAQCRSHALTGARGQLRVAGVEGF